MEDKKINDDTQIKNNENEKENILSLNNISNEKKLNNNFSLYNIEIKSIEESNNKEKKINLNSEKNFSFENNSTEKTLLKKSYSSTTSKKRNLYNLIQENKKISKMNFLGKKKKILSSEEIELEKIRKEKEEIKKLKLKHQKCYLKSKNYIPMAINPSPSTIIKPFNLSSNNYSYKLIQSKKTFDKNKINNEKRNFENKNKNNINTIFIDKEKNENLNLNNNELIINYNTPIKKFNDCLNKNNKIINIEEVNNEYFFTNDNEKTIKKEKDLTLTSRIKKYYEYTKDILEKQKQNAQN